MLKKNKTSASKLKSSKLRKHHQVGNTCNAKTHNRNQGQTLQIAQTTTDTDFSRVHKGHTLQLFVTVKVNEVDTSQ